MFSKIKGEDRWVANIDDRFDKNLKNLPPDVYDILEFGGLLSKPTLGFKKVSRAERLITLTSGKAASIINKCEEFLSKEKMDKYGSLGLCHKMGIILYGPTGTGKTSLVWMIMNRLMSACEAVCLDCTGNTPHTISWAIEEIRQNTNVPIVIFIDEIEQSLRECEEPFLTFLDGNDSTQNIIIIGCTNYISDISPRFTQRKSRFRHIIKIDSFREEIYEEFIKGIIGKEDTNRIPKLAYYAKEAKLTMDELKHVIIDHVIENIPIDKAIESAKSSTNKIRKEENRLRKIRKEMNGFDYENDDEELGSDDD